MYNVLILSRILTYNTMLVFTAMNFLYSDQLFDENLDEK